MLFIYLTLQKIAKGMDFCMNIEKSLQKDGIIVTEKVDTDTILTITKSISQK